MVLSLYLKAHIARHSKGEAAILFHSKLSKGLICGSVGEGITYQAFRGKA